jgi:hypothetical protein
MLNKECILRSNSFKPLFFIFFLLGTITCTAQQKDSLPSKKDSVPAAKVDSLIKADHSPRKAAIRSAIIPGWGQVYNKKYWKVPIVYAAIGITGYIFVDNLKTYQDLRLAYRGKYNARVKLDSTDYFKIKDRYLPISEESLRAGRDQFRRYIDYSAIFFVVFWGLYVVDAVVDARLTAFDISPDLSLKIKPSFNPVAKTKGVSLVLALKNNHSNKSLPAF